METSKLTGALLDYWVARAEGVPATEITMQSGRAERVIELGVLSPAVAVLSLAYSTDWAQGGPLIEKHHLKMRGCRTGWFVSGSSLAVYGEGAALLEAICRAVVRAKFGDEVAEVGDA